MRKMEGQHRNLHRCCIMRKVISKKVNAGGRFDLVLDFATGYTTTAEFTERYGCIAKITEW